MFRRHWLSLLIAGALAYFGVAAAPVLAQMNAPHVMASR